MIAAPAAAAPRRVLIVCHANTSRSIIAEAVLLRLLARAWPGRAVAVALRRHRARSRATAAWSRSTRKFVLRDIGIPTPPKRRRHRPEAQPPPAGRRRPDPGDDRRAAPHARRASRRPTGQARADAARAGGRDGRHRRPVDAGRGRVPALPRRDRASAWKPVCRVCWRSERMVLGLFKKTPKLEATLRAHASRWRASSRRKSRSPASWSSATSASDAELTDLEVVLVAGGTRRIDLELPATWRGTQRVPGRRRAARDRGLEGRAGGADARVGGRDPAQHHGGREARAALPEQQVPAANE